MKTAPQDTWHATRHLTLTYGLRWDVDFAPSSLSGPSIPAVTGYNELRSGSPSHEQLSTKNALPERSGVSPVLQTFCSLNAALRLPRSGGIASALSVALEQSREMPSLPLVLHGNSIPDQIQVNTTILPPALFSSIQRCASTISSRWKILPT